MVLQLKVLQLLPLHLQIIFLFWSIFNNSSSIVCNFNHDFVVILWLTILDVCFGKSKISDYTYKILFLLFIVIGAAGDMSAVWTFSDAMILALVFPNMIGLFFLFPKVKEELHRYLKAIRA
ncbi:MAG: hypothetical protein CM15mP83_6720 [Flavobacteriaceae bacterium]|nr:MAG: hypothetical protein CM15mP83_6720 [Flavobacteriaceae bacterium]